MGSTGASEHRVHRHIAIFSIKLDPSRISLEFSLIPPIHIYALI